jgi:Dehydrogenases with different specificities (related to short-chain alcohol dehydrogenases)
MESKKGFTLIECFYYALSFHRFELIYIDSEKMEETSHNIKCVLITGGTSGLGLELVKLFHEKGFDVICTGRQPQNLPGYEKRFQFISIDFSDLAGTARTIYEICRTTRPDFVISNAGVLSPPGFTLTGDVFEYTFQVNFLAHLLVNEIIVRNNPGNFPLKIAAVTSPVYKMANSFPNWKCDIRNYRPIKSYSDSKLFLAMMGVHLAAKYPDKNLACLSIDPGVFSSAIYRTQGRLFRLLYRFAAPFMRNPANVAKVIYEMMVQADFSGRAIYNTRKRPEYLPEFDQVMIELFWVQCNEMLNQYYKL